MIILNSNALRNQLNHNNIQNIIFEGPQGLLQGKAFNLQKANSENLALILSPDPVYKGTMNNPIVNLMFNTFKNLGFSVLKFNYRGVGESKGVFSNKEDIVEDALYALDWLINKCENTKIKDLKIFVSGFSLGGWIALQAAMRRPEISNFITINSQFYNSEFNMLTPCPNGLMIQSLNDKLFNYDDSKEFSDRLIKQKGCSIMHQPIEDDHYLSRSITTTELMLIKYIKAYKINSTIQIKRY